MANGTTTGDPTLWGPAVKRVNGGPWLNPGGCFLMNRNNTYTSDTANYYTYVNVGVRAQQFQCNGNGIAGAVRDGNGSAGVGSVSGPYLARWPSCQHIGVAAAYFACNAQHS